MDMKPDLPAGRDGRRQIHLKQKECVVMGLEENRIETFLVERVGGLRNHRKDRGCESTEESEEQRSLF
jgi:hypothetical protein